MVSIKPKFLIIKYLIGQVVKKKKKKTCLYPLLSQLTIFLKASAKMLTLTMFVFYYNTL